jgi:hypothetical protein
MVARLEIDPVHRQASDFHLEFNTAIEEGREYRTILSGAVAAMVLTTPAELFSRLQDKQMAIGFLPVDGGIMVQLTQPSENKFNLTQALFDRKKRNAFIRSSYIALATYMNQPEEEAVKEGSELVWRVAFAFGMTYADTGGWIFRIPGMFDAQDQDVLNNPFFQNPKVDSIVMIANPGTKEQMTRGHLDDFLQYLYDFAVSYEPSLKGSLIPPQNILSERAGGRIHQE